MDHGPNALRERWLHDSVELFAGEGCVYGMCRDLYIYGSYGRHDSLMRMFQEEIVTNDYGDPSICARIRTQ